MISYTLILKRVREESLLALYFRLQVETLSDTAAVKLFKAKFTLLFQYLKLSFLSPDISESDALGSNAMTRSLIKNKRRLKKLDAHV